MYVSPNYKNKKALKEAMKAGEHVMVFQPVIGDVPVNGKVYLEGPHYPEPHKWYAEGIMKNGKLVSIK